MQSSAKSRLNAFGVHLALSILIFILLSAVIYFMLYPGVLFVSDGGLRGMRLIAGVDLVVGPLLTLILYRKGKPGLAFDLSLVALLQIVLLIVGSYIVYSERPVAVVFADGKFHSMSKDSYSLNGIDVDGIDVFSRNTFSPQWFIVQEPESAEELSKLRRSQLKDGAMYLRYDLYEEYVSKWRDIEKYDLITKYKNSEKIYFSDLKRQDVWVFPFISRYADKYALVSRDTGEILDVFD